MVNRQAVKAEPDHFLWALSSRFRELLVLSGREGNLTAEQGLGAQEAWLLPASAPAASGTGFWSLDLPI